MKKVFLLLLLISTSIFAQTEEALKKQAIKEASETAQAMLDLDFKTIAKYTHPNIIKAMGGEDKMIAILENSFGGMLQSGVKFEESKIGKLLDFKKEQNQYRCLIENFLTMSMQQQGKRVKRKSTLFGFYDEKIKKWTFVEANKMQGGAASKLFPEFKTSITIPIEDQKVENL